MRPHNRYKNKYCKNAIRSLKKKKIFKLLTRTSSNLGNPENGASPGREDHPGPAHSGLKFKRVRNRARNPRAPELLRADPGSLGVGPSGSASDTCASGAMRLWPQAWGAVGSAWRECFPLQGHEVARWFPGHMAKGETRGRRGRPGRRPWRLLWLPSWARVGELFHP